MAETARHAAHEPLPETDWLSEFPSEAEMDSAWAQSRTGEDPFDFFAREETASADVALLRPADDPPVAAIDPAIHLIAAAPAVTEVAVVGDRGTRAPRVRRPMRAAVAAGALAVLAAAMFFVVPRAITTPELPPRLVPPIAAPPSLPALASAPPPDAQIAAPPEPPPPTAPPADLERLNNRSTSAKPAPPAPPSARPAPPTAPPAPASSATTTGVPQQLPPPPPPALALSPALGSALPGIGRANPVVVSPPPEIPPPPSTPSRPPAEPGRGGAAPAPAASTPPSTIDLAAATAAVEIAAIDAVLGGYRRAFNALDVERVEQVWPEVDRRALERAFRGLAKQTFEFDTCQVRPNGTDAQASCSGRASYVPKVGGRGPQVETREWQFTLTKRNGRWVIAAVESKR